MTEREAVTVRLRVVWLASHGGGRHGRVVVHRTVSGGPEVARFWLSGPMPPAALVAATRGPRRAAWGDLLLGLPVGELAAPVPLRPARRADLDELSQELAGSDAVEVVQRPLLLAGAELVAGAAVSARVVRFAGDVLAHAFDGVFEGPPPGLLLGKTTVEGTAVSAHEAATRFAVDAWIALADVTAARPVEGRGRVTTLVLEPHPDSAPEAPLAGADVRLHVASVAGAPHDTAAREALVAALTRAGWRVDAAVATVDVGSAGADELVDQLDGLLVLAVHGPGGAQAVTLVSPTRATTTLLRSHERLAAALAADLAPPAGSAGSAGSAGPSGGAAARIERRRELRAALRAAAGDGSDEPG